MRRNGWRNPCCSLRHRRKNSTGPGKETGVLEWECDFISKSMVLCRYEVTNKGESLQEIYLEEVRPPE